VNNHICTPCSLGSLKTIYYNNNGVRLYGALGAAALGGDDASGDDTTCEDILCEENEHVENHVCVPCSGDLINEAGDNANSDDTRCREVILLL